MRLTAWILAGCLFGMPGPASASRTYPAEVQKQLALSYVPACAICHANGATGFGTVTTPFGEALRAEGLVCCNIASLDTALAALEAQMSPYITDLKENRDPNDPNQSAASPITYGCFNTTGQGPVAGGLVLGLVLLVCFRVCSGRGSRSLGRLE